MNTFIILIYDYNSPVNMHARCNVDVHVYISQLDKRMGIPEKTAAEMESKVIFSLHITFPVTVDLCWEE